MKDIWGKMTEEVAKEEVVAVVAVETPPPPVPLPSKPTNPRYYGFYHGHPDMNKYQDNSHLDFTYNMNEDELLQYIGYEKGLTSSADREGVAYCNQLYQLRQRSIPTIAQSGLINRLELIQWEEVLFSEKVRLKREQLAQELKSKIDAVGADGSGAEIYSLEYDYETLTEEVDVKEFKKSIVQLPLPPLPPLPENKQTLISEIPQEYLPYTKAISVDREGTAYFEKLSKFYKPLIADGGYLSSANYSKPIQIQEILRPSVANGSTFQISYASWPLLAGSLGPSGEAKEIVPTLPEIILRRKRGQNISKLYLYSQYISFLKIKAMAEGKLSHYYPMRFS